MPPSSAGRREAADFPLPIPKQETPVHSFLFLVEVSPLTYSSPPLLSVTFALSFPCKRRSRFRMPPGVSLPPFCSWRRSLRGGCVYMNSGYWPPFLFFFALWLSFFSRGPLPRFPSGELRNRPPHSKRGFFSFFLV